MTTMRDAYQNWEPPELPTHFDAFSAGWKAAIAAVKAGGVVAIHNATPLYKLPEEMK